MRDQIKQIRKRCDEESSRSGRPDNRIAPNTIQNSLRGLQLIGAIQKEGEPNREGTLYRVLTPEKIEACEKYRAQRLAGDLPEEVLEQWKRGSLHFASLRSG